MKIKQVGNKYRKASWWEEHEMFTYVILAMFLWAAVLAVYFI